jgi:hypothetical protein
MSDNKNTHVEVKDNGKVEKTKVTGQYRRPEVHDLGKLEQVQAGRGYYYDGPRTTWLRF